jgi:hypothetical protein
MPALLPSSGTTNFAPSFGDFILDAFSRIQIRPTELLADHYFQARLSAQLLLGSEWVNSGMPLLYKVGLLQIPLFPGVANYTLPSNVVAPLDAFIRSYQMGQAQNFTPVFTTTSGSLSVIVHQPGHGLTNGEAVWYPGQIAASGIIIWGVYIVTSILGMDDYEITVANVPDGTGSVAMPIFTAINNSSSVAVHLPAHGMNNGQTFYVNIVTTVGGIQLSGGFTVIGTPGPDDFVIQAPQTASSTQTIVMNGGLAQAQTQIYNVDWTDFVLFPISRTDYASQPDKEVMFRPTTFWFQRLRQPILTFWNNPDNAGPYVLNVWVMQRPDDIVIEGGVGVDIVFRFEAAFAAALASKLYRKFPEKAISLGITFAELKAEADELYVAALKEDIERTAIFIQPGVWSYYR